MRIAVSTRTAVEETDDSEGAAAAEHSSAVYESGDGSAESMALRLKRFAKPIDKGFTHKVHFFQALEQGAFDRRVANIEDADMALVRQMGGDGEPQGADR